MTFDVMEIFFFIPRSLIAEKGVELDREVKYLVNKAKIAKAEKDRERLKKEAEEKQKAEEKKRAEEKEKKKKKKKEKAAAAAYNETKEEEVKEGETKPEDEAKQEEEPPLDDAKLEPEPDQDGKCRLKGAVYPKQTSSSNFSVTIVRTPCHKEILD